MKVISSLLLAIFVLGFAFSVNAQSSSGAYEEAVAIAKAGRWTVKEVQHPRLLGMLGRVEVLVENTKGERKRFKLSQRNHDVITLNTGDVVVFTLAPTIEKGGHIFPAFEVEGRHKLPNPYLLDEGSYLILHRVQ